MNESLTIESAKVSKTMKQKLVKTTKLVLVSLVAAAALGVAKDKIYNKTYEEN